MKLWFAVYRRSPQYFWTSVLGGVIIELAVVDAIFFRFIPLYELALLLSVMAAVSFAAAYFGNQLVREFSLTLTLYCVIALLVLSCFTGVGWQNPIVTAILDTWFRLVWSHESKLVKEALVDGIISPEHVRAYRIYQGVTVAGRLCFLIVLLVPAAIVMQTYLLMKRGRIVGPQVHASETLARSG